MNGLRIEFMLSQASSNLISKDEECQMNLFSNTKNENLCSAIDNLRENFGDNIINLAKDYKE